jgi:hypothetical protein
MFYRIEVGFHLGKTSAPTFFLNEISPWQAKALNIIG